VIRTGEGTKAAGGLTMLQRFVDPVAIAAQIKHVQAMHCGGAGEHCSPGRSRSTPAWLHQ
jgi:hypothetical protein